MTRYASMSELQRALTGSDVKLPENANRQPTKLQAVTPQPSHLEALFAQLWQLAGGEPLEAEYQFDAVRRWRFDFADVGRRVAIEIEGGLHGGRHTKAAGYVADCEKYNAATMAGWRVIRLTTAHLRLDYIEKVLAWQLSLS